jgi:hypothetical protein
MIISQGLSSCPYLSSSHSNGLCALLIRIGGVYSISPTPCEPSFGVEPMIRMKSPWLMASSRMGSLMEKRILKCSHSSMIWTCFSVFFSGEIDFYFCRRMCECDGVIN